MLNPQQQAAVDHDHRPLLIIAGAGTGKTTVMAHRAAALVARGTAPDRLLLLTFTRKAAEELRQRVAARLGVEPGALPWCGTFHSVSARLLRRYGRHVGLSGSFSILDESDSRELLWRAAEETFTDLDPKAWPGKSMLMRIHSYRQNKQITVAEAVAETAPEKYLPLTGEIAAVFDAYAGAKRAGDMLDFDDLLLAWLDLLNVGKAGVRGNTDGPRRPSTALDGSREILPYSPAFDCASLFDCVMVDEYQDTNVLQSRILAALCRGHGRITVVGDDAQAIYGFRGATVENILAFPDEFPGATQCKLEANYRSTQEILDAANALWAEAGRGYAKILTATKGAGTAPKLVVCRDEWEQAERVVNEVARSYLEDKVPLREQAVLFRSSHHSFRLEAELKKLRIPYRKFGGQSFTDAAHIKDAFAFLRAHENPKDTTAWGRILLMLPGVGPATARKCIARLAESADPAAVLAGVKLPAKAQPFRTRLLDLLAHQFSGDEIPLQEELETVIDFYRDLLPVLYDTPDLREAGLREMLTMASHYESRREFLDEMLTGNDVTPDSDTNPDEYLTLSTIHSAKGCEWRRVHLLQLVEGGLPSAPSQDDDVKIDEERRLLYVAMTRAKERLHLYQPRATEGFKNGQRTQNYTTPSRFLTPAVLAALEGGWDARSNRVEYDEAPAGGGDSGELIYDYDGDGKPPGNARKKGYGKNRFGYGHYKRHSGGRKDDLPF
jgi:DNA helicase-2/ATP-dependent DNA helicase PcrA